MRKGRIGICVATQIARYVKETNPFPGWHSPAIAWSMTQAQLAWYHAMEELGEMRQIWKSEYDETFNCGGGTIAEASKRAQPQIQALLDKAWQA